MQRNTYGWIVAAGLCGFAGPALAQNTQPVKEIKIKLTNSQGQPAGTATFKQKKDGVQVKVVAREHPVWRARGAHPPERVL